MVRNGELNGAQEEDEKSGGGGGVGRDYQAKNGNDTGDDGGEDDIIDVVNVAPFQMQCAFPIPIHPLVILT